MSFYQNPATKFVFFKNAQDKNKLYISTRYALEIPAGLSYRVKTSPPDSNDNFTIYALMRENPDYAYERRVYEEIMTLIKDDLSIDISQSNNTIEGQIEQQLGSDFSSVVTVIIVPTEGDDISQPSTIEENGEIEIVED